MREKRQGVSGQTIFSRVLWEYLNIGRRLEYVYVGAEASVFGLALGGGGRQG